MSRRRLAFSIAAITILLIAAASGTHAQNKQTQSPEDKDVLPASARRWQRH